MTVCCSQPAARAGISHCRGRQHSYTVTWTQPSLAEVTICVIATPGRASVPGEVHLLPTPDGRGVGAGERHWRESFHSGLGPHHARFPQRRSALWRRGLAAFGANCVYVPGVLIGVKPCKESDGLVAFLGCRAAPLAKHSTGHGTGWRDLRT